MKKEGMSELTAEMIAEVEKIRHGFEMGSRIGVTQLGRSKEWRKDLEHLVAMEVVDRQQTTAILLKPEVFKALMEYINKMDRDLEQAQVEALFEHRRDTTEFLSGEELATKAKESFRARKEKFRKFLDGDQ